jgi:hypothetical protein
MHLILLRDLFSIVLAGLMVLIVVYAVSIARLTRWTINADRDPVPLDPLANPFPGGIGEHFDQVQADLQTEGFEPVADYALPDLVANGAAFARMFVNRAQQEVARGTAICLKHPMVGWKLRRTSCQFETSFSDGTGLMTTNSLAPRMLPPPPEFRGSIRVDVRDVARLRRIHQKVVERFANGRSKEFVFETRFTGDALRYHAWVAGVPNAFNPLRVLLSSRKDRRPATNAQRCDRGRGLPPTTRPTGFGQATGTQGQAAAARIGCLRVE